MWHIKKNDSGLWRELPVAPFCLSPSLPPPSLPFIMAIVKAQTGTIVLPAFTPWKTWDKRNGTHMWNILQEKKSTFTACASACWGRKTWMFWRFTPGFTLWLHTYNHVDWRWNNKCWLKVWGKWCLIQQTENVLKMVINALPACCGVHTSSGSGGRQACSTAWGSLHVCAHLLQFTSRGRAERHSELQYTVWKNRERTKTETKYWFREKSGMYSMMTLIK